MAMPTEIWHDKHLSKSDFLRLSVLLEASIPATAIPPKSLPDSPAGNQEPQREEMDAW